VGIKERKPSLEGSLHAPEKIKLGSGGRR